MIMLTDNRVLLTKHVESPALICAQRKAEKIIPTEMDFIQSNIASFGNSIGAITNRATSMFEVQSRFSESSKEYKVLDYRIACGQLFQQNAIDRAKGIISKPMPKTWYDKFAVHKMDDNQDFYRAILADKKPYFMCYIYPSLMREYKKFCKQADRNSLREFEVTVSEMKELPYAKLTDRQKEFLYYYDLNLPVGLGECVVNRVCRRIEQEFDGYYKRHHREGDFDYTIMKSGHSYSSRKLSQIRELHQSFNRFLQDYQIMISRDRVDDWDSALQFEIKREAFVRECLSVCSNDAELCEIVLDLCYTNSKSKKFAWSLCGSQIIKNLLANNNNLIQFPTQSVDGEILFKDCRFEIRTMEISSDAPEEIGGDLDDCIGQNAICEECLEG